MFLLVESKSFYRKLVVRVCKFQEGFCPKTNIWKTMHSTPAPIKYCRKETIGHLSTEGYESVASFHQSTNGQYGLYGYNHSQVRLKVFMVFSALIQFTMLDLWLSHK